MDFLTQMSEIAAAALLCATALFATSLLAGDDAPDEGHTWGDDPTVVAMLSGMSL